MLKPFIQRFVGNAMQPKLLSLKMAVVLLVLIFMVSSIFLLRLEFNNAPEIYFPKDSPASVLERQVRSEFPDDEVLVALFSGGDLYSKAFLLALERLGDKLAKHPDVDKIFSVITAEHIQGTEDGFAVERLIDTAQLDGVSADELKARAINDRFAPGWLVSKDGSALALVIRAKSLHESRQREAIEHALHEAVAEEKLDKYLVAVAGSIPLDVAQMRSMQSDSLLFTPIVVTLGLLLLWWVVGNIVPVWIGALAMSTVTVSSVALIVALNQPYTLVTAMLPTLLSAYTTANLLHLYAALQRLRRAGYEDSKCVVLAIQGIHDPALFNLLTTSAGMLSLVLVPIPPIQIFGIAAAFGSMMIYLVLFYLVPPLLVNFDRGVWPQKTGGFAWTRRISYGLARFSIRYAGWVVGGMTLVTLALLPQITKVQAESDMLKYFKDKHYLTQSTKVIEEKLTGVTSLEIIVDGPGRDSFKDVERLKLLKMMQERLEKLPEIDRTLSMADVVEEMNGAFAGAQDFEKVLPENNKKLSQLLLIYDGEDLQELVNKEYQRARILININVHGANAVQRVIEKINDHAAQLKVQGVTWQVAGSGRLFSDQEDLLVVGQVHSFFGAFGQIFIIMLILWRSAPVAVIGMLPNLAPLGFIFVLMGTFGIYLDFATVLIASIALGITVDDTIHFFHNYFERRKKGLGVVFSLARSFEAAGRAVVAISVLLVLQFLVLTTSDFVPTVNFGLLTASGLLAGQVLELLLLPALLVLWGKLNFRCRFLKI